MASSNSASSSAAAAEGGASTAAGLPVKTDKQAVAKNVATFLRELAAASTTDATAAAFAGAIMGQLSPQHADVVNGFLAS